MPIAPIMPMMSFTPLFPIRPFRPILPIIPIVLIIHVVIFVDARASGCNMYIVETGALSVCVANMAWCREQTITTLMSQNRACLLYTSDAADE